MRILLFSLVILFSSNIYGQKTIPSDKLLEDYDLLVSELRSKHQGLYQYVEKTVVDKKLDSLRQQAMTPMTKLAFYGLVRALIGLTNEGHTSADLPNWDMLKVGLPKSLLPLTVSFYDKELIVSQNYGKNITGLEKGARILSINGKTVDELTQDLFPLIPTDGFNETSKYEWVGNINLSLLYRLVYGKEKQFDIEIQTYGSETIQHISIPPIRYTAFKSKNALFENKNFDFSDFTFKQINDSIAYLSIPSFSDDELDYESFYRAKFQAIDSLGIKHLVLDLQDNGGGEEGNENLLYSYLNPTVIQKYSSVTMPSEVYEKNKTDEDYIMDKWTLDGPLAERGDFTLRSDYYSNLGYKAPAKDLVYDGQLYVLISGITFSGGAEMASLIKMTDRATFIGEETGGTYEGNVSGYSRTVKLPNTKISVRIPIVHYQINVSPKVRGRGIMPDHTVPQAWTDYMTENNTKLNFTLELIRNHY